MLTHKRIQVVDDEERLTKTTEASGPNYLEAQIVDSAGVLYTVPKVTPFGKKSWILDLGTTVYRVHLAMKKMRQVDLAKVKQLVLDVVRDYRWGRVEETIGEDPYLVATTACAYVRGLQSAGVIATLKHFAAHGSHEGGRDATMHRDGRGSERRGRIGHARGAPRPAL
jgi:hypothetical protein